jgi:Flp pilus assembly protein TadD
MRWAPWSANAIEQLGEVQSDHGDLKAARQTYRKALAKNPEDWNLWFDLAIASEGKTLRDAVAHATRLNPRDRELAGLRRALELQDRNPAAGKAGTQDAP